MDKSYHDDSLFFISVSMQRTDDKRIKLTHVNDSTIDITEHYVEDDGDPILNYNNYTVLKEGATPTLGWEGNKLYLTQVYPITKEWFEQREKEKEKETSEDIIDTQENSIKQKVEEQARLQTIEDFMEQIKEQKEVIGILKEKQKELITENAELQDKNRKLQNMLNKTLQFCETVRKSKFGQFFFRKQLKALPEADQDNER